jgi:cyclohexadienyl dehydratase
MRRWWIAIIVVVVAVIVIVGQLLSARRAPSMALPRITAAGVIRVCSSGDYRPFTFLDDHSRWSGLDVDMAGDLARDLGVRLQLVQTSWQNLLTDTGKTCDIAMGGISITDDRAEHALFTTPYLGDGKAAIARCADAGRFHGLDDINRPGVNVIVNPGGSNADFDRTHLHHAHVTVWPDNNTIFDALAANAADVMITDVSEIRWQTNLNRELCGIALDHPFTVEQKAYLVPRTSPDLQEWTDRWLDTVLHDGTYAALERTYFGPAG